MRRASSVLHELLGYRGTWTGQYQLIANYSSAKDQKAVSLPHLPVPKLHDTLQKYLKSVKPHLSVCEYETTSKLVQQFGADGGTGQKLQVLLEQRAQKLENWLEEWWINSAYLDFRSPVVVYSNPGLVLPFRLFNDQCEQLKYAADSLLAAIDYKNMIYSDAIPQEMMGKAPLDMQQYKKVFGTCRIPGVKRDSISYNDSKHVTVIHNEHIFHVDVYGSDGCMLNSEQLVEALQQVVCQSREPSATPLGVLTSENRNVWGQLYQDLIKDECNAENLKDIARSLVVVCLDRAVGLQRLTDKAAQQTLAAAQTIHGGGTAAGNNGANRWYDKTIQMIIGADGVTGLCYEHSPAEGQPVAIMTDFIIDFIDKDMSKGRPPSKCPIEPVKLNFNITSQMRDSIEKAKANLDRLAYNLELNCFTFNNYGKDFIKSQKLSPDSYLQMAMQYAFFRVHQQAGAHYESAATRMFVGGRTETIRSCSVESVAFACAMLDPTATPAQRADKLRAAIKAHKNYTVQALQGLGVDRHLLGLKLIALENNIEVPNLYTDKGYVKSSHMRLSTSQVAARCDAFMCYGPLVPDGYATCYNPRARNMNFATAAFRHPDTCLPEYRCALEQALNEMHDLCLASAKGKL